MDELVTRQQPTLDAVARCRTGPRRRHFRAPPVAPSGPFPPSAAQRGATPAGRRCPHRVAAAAAALMAPRAHPTSEDRKWRRRHRRGGSRTGGSMIGLRLRELEIIFWSRYGGRRLPPDDSGTEDAMMALHHLAGLTIDPRGRMTTWLSTWAPWMPRRGGGDRRARRRQADTAGRHFGRNQIEPATRPSCSLLGHHSRSAAVG